MDSPYRWAGSIGNLQISFRKLDIYVIYIACDDIWDVVYADKSDFSQNSILSKKIKIVCPDFGNFGSQILRADKRYHRNFFCKWIFGSWTFWGRKFVCGARVGYGPQPTQVGWSKWWKMTFTSAKWITITNKTIFIRQTEISQCVGVKKNCVGGSNTSFRLFYGLKQS